MDEQRKQTFDGRRSLRHTAQIAATDSDLIPTSEKEIALNAEFVTAIGLKAE
jgi:hypothetical protein